MANSYLERLYKSFGDLFARSVNGVKPDSTGDIKINSVASADTAKSCSGNSATATKATQDALGNVINTHYTTKAEANAINTAVVEAQTTANQAVNDAQTAQTTADSAQNSADTAQSSADAKIAKSGNRGTLAGYATPSTTSSAISVSASSTDDIVVSSAVSVTVANGSSGQTWVKTVSLLNASATVSLGSSWQWANGVAPKITAKSVLVLKWTGSFGIANLVVGA